MVAQRDTVAVVGCGLIGESWTALFIAFGHDVIAWDESPAVMEGFSERVEHARKQVCALQGPGAICLGRLTMGRGLDEAVSDASWIQESVPESVPVKLDLYRRMEKSARDSSVIASSTSSLTWSDLSPGFERSQRFITAHPFNPPHLMPLVEIYSPNSETRAKAESFYQALDRQTVSLSRDAVGHIANRLSSALWREAVNIVAEGIAKVADVDAALVHGPGLRWSVVGSHMGYHLGGGPGGIEHYLSHLGPSQERRWATLGTPSLTPELCRLLIDGVAEEVAGRSLEMLAAERDDALIRVIAARKADGRAS
jgi:carnitine 3-dehydrogenase